MTWLTWRQFRTQALVVFGGLALVAIATVVTGMQIRAWVRSCAAPAVCYGTPVEAYLARYVWLVILLRGGLLVLPAITGIFWAAPLVAREFDTGTYRLVWTQSVSRVRWLTVKILVVGLASVLASGLLSWLTTWWYGPADQVNDDKFVDSTFGIRDVVPMGYAAFAFALGLAAGLVIRKVLPAMATTLVGFVAVRMVVQVLVRAHYAAPLSESGPLADPSGDNAIKIGGALPKGSWVVTTQIFDPAGHPAQVQFGPAAPCFATNTCLDGYTQHLIFQPGSRYWAFQWIETGLFTVLAVLLIGFSYWWIAGRRLPGRAPRPGRSTQLRAMPAVQPLRPAGVPTRRDAPRASSGVPVESQLSRSTRPRSPSGAD